MSLATPSRIQQLQRKLYHKSKAEPNFRFYTLWDKAYRMDVLEEAWRRVRVNRGAGGIDGKTIESIEEAGVELFLAELQADLIAKTYTSQPVRRVWIPKPDGKKRPLGIPTIRDRVAQMAVKIVLEPILEATFMPCSYGFRPKRSAHDAVHEIEKLLNWGKVRVIDADIRDFFGQIPHAKLLRVIAGKVADGQILRVIRQWLGAGVMDEGRVRNESTGTPQGGVISPLLANAYLNELDVEWDRKKLAKRREWSAFLIRYADDLVILTDQGRDKPMETLRKCLSNLGLELHPEKTRQVNAEKESFDFLGFTFRKVMNRERTKRFPLVLPSRKAEASIRAKVRELTRYERTDKLEVVIQDLNPVVRGWVNYFRIGNCGKPFNQLRDYVGKKLRRYVRRKQLMRGFGWKTITGDVLYGRCGLFYDYHIRYDAAGVQPC